MPDMPGIDSVLPPQNKDAEESLVGCLLINAVALDEISLKETDFYFNGPRTVYEAMRAIRETGQPVDIVTVSNWITANKDFDALGGAAYLMALVGRVSSMNVTAYADMIADDAQRRRLIQYASDLAKIAYNRSTPYQEQIPEIMSDLAGVVSPKRGSRHISQGLGELYDFVEERMNNPKSVWGVPTGFKRLDGFTGGLQPGLWLYIAGEPGIGKSKIAYQIGLQAALPENGSHSVAIYSFEMPEIEVNKRLTSIRKNITTYQMNTGKITPDQFELFLHDLEYLERLRIFVCDTPMTPAELHADIAKRKKNDGVELVIVDYLLMMRGYEDLDETPRSGILSRALKLIGSDVGVAGLVVASTTKEAFDDKETASMRKMRGSAQVLFDADGVAFLRRSKDMGMQDIASLQFVKMPRTVNRSIEGSMIPYRIDSEYPMFHELNAQDIKSIDLSKL